MENKNCESCGNLLNVIIDLGDELNEARRLYADAKDKIDRLQKAEIGCFVEMTADEILRREG